MIIDEPIQCLPFAIKIEAFMATRHYHFQQGAPFHLLKILPVLNSFFLVLHALSSLVNILFVDTVYYTLS
jgi:hypothetical protein